MQNGYKKSELYVTTWGNGNYSKSNSTVFNQNNVMYMRKFMEAVLAYTGAS